MKMKLRCLSVFLLLNFAISIYAEDFRVGAKKGHNAVVDRVLQVQNPDNTSSDYSEGNFFIRLDGKMYEYFLMRKGFIPPSEMSFVKMHQIPEKPEKKIPIKIKIEGAPTTVELSKINPFFYDYVDIIISLGVYAWGEAKPDSSGRVGVYALVPMTEIRPDYFPVKVEGLLSSKPGKQGEPPQWSAQFRGFVDIDVDSDNDDGYNDKWKRTDDEDLLENMSEKDDKRAIGKVFLVNNGDVDGDGISDFADGFNATDKLTKDDTMQVDKIEGNEQAFGVPVVLELNIKDTDLKPAEFQYSFTYKDSDPKNATITDVKKDENGKIISCKCTAPAGFRIWMNKEKTRKKGNVNALGEEKGDFIPSNTPINADSIGMEAGHTHTFYVEAVPGAENLVDNDLTILVKAEIPAKKVHYEDTIKLRPISLKFTFFPTNICAKSTWNGVNKQDYRYFIVINTIPKDFIRFINLVITEVEPKDERDNANVGTLHKPTDNTWEYIALSESRDDKWPGIDDMGKRYWDVTLGYGINTTDFKENMPLLRFVA